MQISNASSVGVRDCTISIDSGGTFTDGFLTSGDRIATVKVETTPHDLTVCFQDCIEKGAVALGFPSAQGLLLRTRAIRYATTIGTNTLIQRSGPRIGLITSTNGKPEAAASTLRIAAGDRPIIPEDLVVELFREEAGGQADQGPKAEAVRSAAKRLLDRGVEVLVISLRGSWANPTTEQHARRIIHDDYPKHYLGSIPVLLASDVTIRPGDDLRLQAAVLNAYLHPALVKYLYKAEAGLRRNKFDRPLLIVHSSGGAARVAKTTALHTYNSGPVAGLMGAGYVAGLYGFERVVTSDVGGTSTDIGVLVGGRPDYDLTSRVDGIEISVPLVRVEAIGAGGGSVARVDAKEQLLQVGPESMGAVPGPACFGLGGREATLTDANVVLGYIDPERFLGGRRKLDPEKAKEALLRRVARPLGRSLEDAALLVRETLENNIRDTIRRLLHARGSSPSDFVLFSYGGGGPLHAAQYGAGFPKVLCFGLGSVFSAFGTSTHHIGHFYEKAVDIELRASDGCVLDDTEPLNRAVRDLQAWAVRDMRGEGFPVEQVEFTLDVEASSGDDASPRRIVRAPSVFFAQAQDVRAACEAIDRAGGATTKGKNGVPSPALRLHVLRLGALARIGTYEMTARAVRPRSVAGLERGHREVFWSSRGPRRTPLYERGGLEAGHVIEGPAIIEAEDTTYAVPEGYRMDVDAYLNLMLERQ